MNAKRALIGSVVTALVFAGANGLPPPGPREIVRVSLVLASATVPSMIGMLVVDEPTDAISREIAVGFVVVDLPNTDAVSREIAVAPAWIPLPPTDAVSREIAIAPLVVDTPLDNNSSREVTVAWDPEKPFFAHSREISVGGNRDLVVQVTFGDIDPGLAPTQTNIIVTDPDGTVQFHQNVNLTGSQYTVSSMPRMHLYVSAKSGHWLRKRGVVSHGSVDTIALSLINGDVDGDNEITLIDYSQLAQAFGSVEGDPNWNGNADLDGDLEITLADYSILARNFGKTGDDE